VYDPAESDVVVADRGHRLRIPTGCGLDGGPGQRLRPAPPDRPGPVSQGKIDAAIAEFRAAVAAQPDRSMVHLWLGRALGRKIQKVGRLKAMRMVGDVRRAFERAVALDPNNLEARSDVPEFYLGAPRSFGGGIDKAEAQADAIAKLNPAMGQHARALIEEKAK
jgi:cytochrome c-type biogenesis protein CcmH/NrfG